MRRIKLTMRAALACVLMWSLAFSGCSVPDDENWTAVKSGIAALPPDKAQAARIEHASHKAHNWITERYPRDTPDTKAKTRTLLRLECTDGSGQTFVGSFKSNEIDDCLYNHATWGSLDPRDSTTPVVNPSRQGMLGPGVMGRNTFSECLNFFKRQMLEAFSPHISAGMFVCDPTFFDGLEDASQDPEWEAERVAVDDLGHGLIASTTPPQWFWVAFGLTVVVVGGVVVSVVYPPSAPIVLPALCALGAEWSCPSSPLYPPGQTPQPEPDR